MLDRGAKIGPSSPDRRRSLTGWKDCNITGELGALTTRGAGGWSIWMGRPTLFAIAVMNVITGLVVLVLLAPLAAGADAGFYRDCAMAGATKGCGGLYPPLTALVTWPLTLLPPSGAAVVMSSIGLAILLVGVVVETRGLARLDRLLVLLAVLGFAPVVHELLLGQVTLPLAATIYLVARRDDAFRNGIPLGIALAIAPKPILALVVVWMLVWRRRALAGSILAALAMTAVAVVVASPDAYVAWLSILLGLGRDSVAGTAPLATHGNLSLWPLDAPKLALALLVAAAAVWAILRDEARGFVAALLAGLVLAPYTGLYAATVLLLAVRPALGFAPRATRLLALGANICLAMLTALVAWAAVALAVAALPSGRGSWRRPPGAPG